MFIDARRTKSALPQEGNVRFGRLMSFTKHCPPGGGRTRLVTGSINIAWRRADASRHRFYKHS